ncbi:hypothetical protein LY28_02610 [Ruminiclostridium sufflavum DSM 19573]|uniref:Butirosin biosynthesis protein H N-terminal domain-containing protein n=1 Tax=Ruminiclostridium sufflavum DSM 19573 TaxID=1121337 RepID=A0A318XKK2_9FIRM|nr:hypothetical protein [Ruminiclostridium sufflavum]PYG86988.1 hypothetical protein LY28_02610 [Ruminiclostridium sufflavum DSM 19573]
MKSEVIIWKKSGLKKLTFFVGSDGKHDETAMALNCFEAAVYNLSKNSGKLDKSQIVPLFIKDINPVLCYEDATGVFSFTSQSSNLQALWHKHIKLNQYVKEQDKNALPFLESLIDKGQMVILQTVFQRIKYYAEYNPDFDLSTYFHGAAPHVNIVVFHEDDKIYYAEKQPYRIRIENFVPYELNNQIGVIKKSDMEEACNFYLRCYTLDFTDEDMVRDAFYREDIVRFIHEISDNYDGRTEQLNGFTKYYGNYAYNRFVELCDNGTDIKKYLHTERWGLFDKMTFDIWMTHGSRQILFEYVVQEIKERGCTENLILLKNTLSESIEKWKLFERVMSRLVKSRRSTFLSPKITHQIKNIIEIEDRLNGLLKSFS